MPPSRTPWRRPALRARSSASGRRGADALVSGFGVESPTDSSPVTDDMEFRIAQVTRAMTCDVLYAVADEGTVRLDDPISEWVPGVPDLADVTLAHLCDSTSGVGSYSAQLSSLFLTNPSRVWNPRELASYGLGQPRTAEPGATYRSFGCRLPAARFRTRERDGAQRGRAVHRSCLRSARPHRDAAARRSPGSRRSRLGSHGSVLAEGCRRCVELHRAA